MVGDPSPTAFLDVVFLKLLKNGFLFEHFAPYYPLFFDTLKIYCFSSDLLLFLKVLISFCFYVFLWISFYFGYYHPFFSYLQILFNSFLSLKVFVWQRCSCCNKYNFFHDKHLQKPTFQKKYCHYD